MTHSASLSLGSEFNDFLFAPIGEDSNGMRLSVLSALARLDIDPWQEAAKLARLPVKAATERLSSLIGALPDWPSMHRDTGTIAASLIGLLPRRSGSATPARPDSPRQGATPNSRTVLYVVVVVFVLTALTMMATRQPTSSVDGSSAPTSGSVSPPQAN
jgi:hypothetical protein